MSRESYLLLLLSTASWSAAAQGGSCEAAAGLLTFVENNYPQSLVFDVFRNNKLVGQHRTEFDTSGRKLTVTSEMNLAIKLLFVTVYRFRYSSVSEWCGENLHKLNAEVDRNGQVTNIEVITEKNVLTVLNGQQRAQVAKSITPTNHWNPVVLEKQKVLNTLTGLVNHVSIKPCAYGNEKIEDAAAGAECFEYSGDLQTRVWYDAEKRWRGLEFEGEDGSIISYVCQQCKS